MRRRDVYWSLFHTPEKRQIDDLRTDAIEVAFEVIPSKDRGEWLVWREGFRNWKPLADFPELIVGLRQAGKVDAASVPAPSPSAGVAAAAGTSATGAAAPMTKAATTVQDRLNRQESSGQSIALGILDESDLVDRDVRYKKKWEVRILTGAKPMVTQTIDISNRGMSLKDPVPKGLARYFNVEIVFADQSIPLMCSEIKSPDGSPSTRIRIEVNHHPTLLQTALLQY